MNLFEKFQWLFMIVAMFLGFTIGQIGNAAAISTHFITPFLMIMLFGIFLQTPLKSLKKGLKNARVVKVALVINFLWTPLLAFLLVLFFFRHTPDVFIALYMDLVTPCTDWFFVFTGIAGGNLAISTVLLPWNLFLQLALLPVYLFLFAGVVVEIQPLIFLYNFLKVLLLPFTAAVLTRNIFTYIKKEAWFKEVLIKKVNVYQSLALMFAIVAMFASQGGILLKNPGLVVRLIVPVALFFIINFFVGQLVGRYFNLTYQEGASLIITILARNAPLALTIAVATFPDRPLVPLVLVVESLIELPMLYLFSQIMLMVYRKGWWPNPI